MMPASNMNGLEGLAYVVMFVAGFCLLGSLLVGPLAVVFAVTGGQRRGVAAMVLGVIACGVGVGGFLLVARFFALFGSGMSSGSSVAFFLPPATSLALGVVALRLRVKRKQAAAV